VEYIPAEQPISPVVKLGRSTRSKAAEPEPKLKMSVEPAPPASQSYANGVEAINEATADANTPSHSNIHQVASPRATTVKSPIEQVQAMDALQNELNEVIKKLPDLDWPDSPTKSKAPPSMASKAAAAKSTAAKTTAAKTTTSKPKPAAAAVSKPAVTRSPSVRTATATNKLIKTTQPSAASRTMSTKSQLNAASKTTSTPTAQPQAKPKARPSSVMITSSSTGYDLTSKAPRPVSMSFPAPPPPARSSKPPTRPTFALPGETITARLKAAREERQRREEEELKKRRAFKARPVPGAVREGPKAGLAPRENAASRARRSIMLEGGVDGLKENRPAQQPAPLRRSATVSGAPSNAPKRASLVVGRPRDDRDRRVAPGVSPGVTRSPSLSVARRVPSSASAASSAAAVPPNGVKVSTSDMAVQKQKAREIFNRDRVEKEARDRDRKDKEDAARKARAQAAERGRQASREWAEKQKRKIEEAAAAKKVAVGEEATVGAVA